MNPTYLKYELIRAVRNKRGFIISLVFPLVLFLIGIPILMGLGLMSFICAIVAAIRASEGGFYFYPLTIRFFT